MGVNGLSQAEAKLLLKALPTLGPNPVSDTPLKSPSNLSAVSTIVLFYGPIRILIMSSDMDQTT
jgi:hypothetical protein